MRLEMKTYTFGYGTAGGDSPNFAV